MNVQRPTGQPSISGEYSTVPPAPGTASDCDRQDSQASASGGVSTLGRYRIVRKLGEGGMGAVYLASDPTLQRQVALKVMLPRFAADSTARERFLREARAAARVKSDHVVTIYDVGEARGLPFLAMELLQGRSLDAHLEAGLEVARIIRIGREIAEGLAAAHALGLVHRDIKPANLWLEEPGERVKILDFGLARLLGEGEALTQEGVIVGTPAYMSPEQAAGQPVDARSDLFSLGGVLYRLCAGRPPFPGDSTLAILSALASHPPLPVRAVNPAVPAALADLIHRLLAKKPEQRPASADEVASILRAMENQPPESASTVAYRPPVKEESKAVAVPANLLPRAWPLVLAGLVGLIVVSVLITFAFRPRPPKDGGEVRQEDGNSTEPKDRPPPDLPPLDPRFARTVQGLRPAERQLAEIKKELIRRNPDFEGNVGPPGGITDLMVLYMTTGKIHDLTPVLALPRLSTLAVINRGKGRGRLEDLRPVAGVKQLVHLKIINQNVSNLSPLKGLKLATVDVSGNRVTDLSPLVGMQLLLLNCDDNPVSDLSPLQGQFISALHLKGTKVRDLRPLRQSLMRHLGHLDISDTKVEDLSPLAGSKLYALHARGVPLDAALLKTLALQEVSLDYDAPKHRDALRDLSTLKRINGKPAEQFWKEVEQ